MSIRLLARIRSLGRFALCAVRLPISLWRGRNEANFELISLDIFGTLLVRLGDEHLARRAGTLEFAKVAVRRGLKLPDDPDEFRVSVEAKLSKSLGDRGKDPEFSNRRVYEVMLSDCGAGRAWAQEEASNLARWEFEADVRCCVPQKSLREALERWHRLGRRVVAVSDTRYTKGELIEWFRRCGIVGIANVYSSADCGVSKFSGKMYAYVSRSEGVTPRGIVHIGDSIAADLLSAAGRGTAVRWSRRPAPLPAVPAAPALGPISSSLEFGYRTLGPLIVGFVRLVLAQAKQDGMTRLTFLARDGHLAFEVAKTFVDPTHSGGPSLDYLYVSRRSVGPLSANLSDLLSADDLESTAAADRLIDQLRAVGINGDSLPGLMSYFGLSELVTTSSEGNLTGRKADTLRRFLADRAGLSSLNVALLPVRQRVLQYLQEREVFSEHTALVDIGWRGTTHETLCAAARQNGLASPRAYYLGLWNPDSELSAHIERLGLVCDHRRGRNLLEASAWNCFAVLEACCRAEHGMVIGYSENAHGTVDPVQLASGAARDAEKISIDAQREIREGVIAYAGWAAQYARCVEPEVEQLRRALQIRLFKLAFFPTKSGRDVGRVLVHSEPTDDDWSSKLILKRAPGLRGWIKGIRSPWKGGYFRLYSGIPGAVAYVLAESVLSVVSTKSKLAIRRRIFGADR